MQSKIVIAILGLIALTVLQPAAGSAQAPGDLSNPGTVEAAQSTWLATMMADGARVFSNNCGRCHNLRASTERSDSSWDVIVSHMRARANLTREEAEAVTVFLQVTNNDGEMPKPPASVTSTVPVGETVAALERLREPER